MDRQAAQHRDGHRALPGWCPQLEAHPIHTGARHVVGAHLGGIGKAVPQRARHRAAVHPRHDRIVFVEDGRAIGRQRLEQLALGLLDRLERPDPRQVDRLDGRHHPDRRHGHLGQLGDLAADVHPHLEDGRLVLRTEPQQRQRQPDLVVHVAFGPQGPPRRTQDRGGRLLGRGLGDAARDADDEWREPATPARSDGSERGLPVGHAHDRHVAEGCGIARRGRVTSTAAAPRAIASGRWS